MNTPTSVSSGWIRAVALSALVCASACARQTRSNSDPRSRPPLKVQVDTRPIDRSAPDRVSYAPMIEKTAASVVYVYSTKEVRGSDASAFMENPILRQFFGLPGLRGDRLPPQTEHGLGSGIVISADGYILTNNHVVDQADEVEVSIGESPRRYKATVIGTDQLADVAVLKIDATGLVPATFGDSDQLKIGDVVLAIGDPFGIGQSVSRGIVSAVGRGNLGIEAVENFIQTDAAINPGNSGGALIDTEGRVVGLNTAILSRSGGFAGVGFAIPINMVRNVAEQIVNQGHVDRGYLGVAPQQLTPDLAEQFGTYTGALLAQVSPGSPADQAGLKPGDIVVKVNGTKIRDAGHLLLTVSQLAPGTSVKIEYLRDGRHENATARLGRRPQENLAEQESEQPPSQNGRAESALSGVVVADLTPQIREELQIPSRIHGAVVTDIDPGSPAAARGIHPGDVILSLDQRPVNSARDCVELSRQIRNAKVMARIWREGQSQFVVIDATTP